ncbi:hypothetical protein D3C78_1859970 [compost metagenome]
MEVAEVFDQRGFLGGRMTFLQLSDYGKGHFPQHSQLGDRFAQPSGGETVVGACTAQRIDGQW